MEPFGWTAVHSAAYMGLNDVIEYLASKGANLDSKDGFGQTALSIANTTLTKEVSSHGYRAPRVWDTPDLLSRHAAR
jgi:ankyrin repeat protein